jgi:hypothetical protein
MARGHWFEFARETRAELLALPRLLNRRRWGRHTQGAKHAAQDLRHDDTSILRIVESRAGALTFPVPPTLGVPNRAQRRRWDTRKIESQSPLDVLGRCFFGDARVSNTSKLVTERPLLITP